MIKLGRIIHAFRLEKGMTLKELAAKSEISISYLSQIENDQVNMCLNVLESISHALDKPLSLFFLQDSIDSISFIKRDERPRILREDHALCERLTDSRLSKTDITIVTYPENYIRQDLVVHQGEEFMLVLSGSLDVNLGGLQVIHMDSGDSISFPSRIPHSIISENGAKVLIHSSTLPFSLI